MPHDSNSVKIEPSERGYHHGALRAALLEAAEAVIAERGVDAFSLRETARRAGVSPSAPAHHFRDARGLMTALAAEAFRHFADALEAADIGETRIERIHAQGLAYVGFALDNPAKFDLMWRYALLDRTNADLAREAGRAFDILDRAVRGDDASERGRDDPSVAAPIACWSLVHGFARLALDGAFGTSPDEIRSAAGNLLPLVLRHLSL